MVALLVFEGTPFSKRKVWPLAQTGLTFLLSARVVHSRSVARFFAIRPTLHS